MQRSLKKGYIGVHPSCVISIVLEHSTLDFEIEQEYWSEVFHSLQIIVNYYQDLLPAELSHRSESLYTNYELS